MLRRLSLNFNISYFLSLRDNKLRILVTGSSGYIGSAVCKEAVSRGHTVIGLDRNSPKHDYLDAVITRDISKKEAAYAVKTCNIEAIFHLAASADMSHSTKRPALYYSNNIGASSKFIDNLLQSGWSGPIIFSSSAAVYGAQNSPCKEHENIKPFNAYGMSKLMCEQLLNDVHNINNLPVVMFRYFNVAGAYDDVGDHLSGRHVLQKLCSCALNNQPFSMFGYDLNTRDGTCLRDYIHVRDAVNAFFHALDFVTRCPGIYTFNLGTKQGTTVKELATRFIERTGKNIDIIPSKSRPGDPSQLVADPSLFIESTKFKYKHSDIDAIIDSAWEWYRRNNGV